MSYNPYWGTATLIQNAMPPLDVSQTIITSFGDYTSPYASFSGDYSSSYAASPALYIDRSMASAVDVTYTSPGYISASPIVGAVYNPLVSIVEPIVPPSTVLIAQPELISEIPQDLEHERYGGRGKRSWKQKPASPKFCDICKVTCATKASVLSHFGGAHHKRKAAQLKRESEEVNPNWKCKICSVSCTSSDSFNSHITGNRHLKKLDENQRNGVTIDQELFPNSNNLQCAKAAFVGKEFIEMTKTATGVSYHCTLCDCNFIDENSKTLHLKGRRHRLAYKQKHDPNIFVEMQPSKRLKASLMAAKKRVVRKEIKSSKIEHEFKVYFWVILNISIIMCIVNIIYISLDQNQF